MGIPMGNGGVPLSFSQVLFGIFLNFLGDLLAWVFGQGFMSRFGGGELGCGSGDVVI